MKQHLWTYIALALLLSGCGNRIDSASTCAEISLFQNQISQEFTPQDYLNWIVETQGVVLSDIKILDTPRGRSAYVWTSGNYRHSVTLTDNQVSEVRIGIVEGGGIPAHIIVECFGEPDVYRAIHDAHLRVRGGVIKFDMVFASGVLTAKNQLYRRLSDVPLYINENFAIDTFVFTGPGTPVEILQQVYYSAPDDTDWMIQPWPENWTDIQPYLTPEMQRIIMQQGD